MVNVKTADILTIQIDEKILPFIIQDIANLIGLGDTLKLVDAYKGTSMWVPAEFKPDHVLVKLIGEQSALKLIKRYAGESVEIPKCDGAMRGVRNTKITTSDKSQSALAREWNLTVRQIRNIQKDVRFDDGQDELF